MCNNCKKDFKDTENFNWSCRVHQSQWSGEMWWCCGKSAQSAPGCKFAKHETKEDEEDPEDAKDPVEALKKTRCMCCKELGHAIDTCPKDPNFKTKLDQDKEEKRVAKIFE